MSGREWKPGDVARTERGGTVARTARDTWVLLDDGYPIDLDHHPRPLVVIDPEDREQAQRLAHLYDSKAIEKSSGEDMQAVLRSLVTPPKPEEPTGRYAEVEDHRGWLYYRDPNGAWRLADNPATPRAYVDISAVKVLSEGVTP